MGKISEFFYLKIFSFLEVKLSKYLNRRVFRNGVKTKPISSVEYVLYCVRACMLCLQ